MEMLAKKPLFNPDGDTDVRLRRMIGGNTTNLNDFNNMRYSWVSGWYRQAMNNFWIPEEISLAQDVKDYPRLDAAERTAYDNLKAGLRPPERNPFMNNVAQAVELVDALDRCAALKTALDTMPKTLDAEGEMHYCHDQLVPAMGKVRETIDHLETLVASPYWPVPTYCDLLFSV